MIAKAYGTRGSVPVSGQNKARYGGNTTAWRITSNRVNADNIIVVDGGSGIVPLAYDILQSGMPSKLNLLFTHYHQDHLDGLGLCPFLHMKGIKKYLFGPKDNGFGPMDAISHVFQSPVFPVSEEQLKSSIESISNSDEKVSMDLVVCFAKDMRTTIPFSQYEKIVADPQSQVHFINDAKKEIKMNMSEVLFVRNMKVEHPQVCVSYRFEEFDTAGKLLSCFVLLTDCEAMSALPGHYARQINGANLLAVDCQYSMSTYETTAGYGHGNPDWVGIIAAKSDVTNIGIIHHDPRASDDNVDSIITEAKQKANSRGVNLQKVKIFGIKDYDEFAF